MEEFVLQRLAGLTVGRASSYLSRRHARRAIASRVLKEARAKGIRVTRGSINAWLRRPDSAELIRGEPVSPTNASATRYLAWLLDGPDREKQAEVLRPIILLEVLRSLEPQDAFVALSRQIERQESVTQSTISRALGNTDAAFDANCELLPQWRAASARSLRSTWPAITQVVDMVVRSPRPGATIREWRETEPGILQDLEYGAYVWLAELAHAYQKPDSAAYFYAKAIDNGATPSAYYWAKAALAQSQQDEATALLDRVTTYHPLSSMLRHVVRRQLPDALAEADGWNCDTGEDACIRIIWLAEIRGRLGDSLHQRQTLEEGHSEHPHSTGLSLALSTQLVDQATLRKTLNPFADLKSAYSLAVSVREKWRSWRLPSDGAAVAAARATAATGDLKGAIRLLTVPPHGEATAIEASGQQALRERALMLAVGSDTVDEARVAIRQLSNSTTADLASGTLDITLGNFEAGREKLHRAFALESELSEKYRIARVLAEAGLSLPDLTAIAETHPAEAAHLRHVQHVMTPDAGRPGRLLRHVDEDPVFGATLAELHSKQGRHAEASEILENIGRAKSMPIMLAHAAEELRYASDYEGATRLWQAALTTAGSQWFAEFDTRGRLCETQFLLGDYEEALVQAVQLLDLRPSDPSARWAATRILIQLARPDDAWSVINHGAHGTEPRDPDEAATWARLAVSVSQAEDPAPHTCGRLVAIAETWSTDATSPGLLMALTELAENPHVTDIQRNELSKAIQELLARHGSPNNDQLQQLPVGPDDDPLRNITPALKSRYETFAELNKLVSDGELPVGTAVLATDSVSLAILDRSAGKVYGYDDVGATERAETVEKALGGRCAIDLTALATLTYFDSASANDLFTSFNGLLSTTDVLKDVVYSQPGALERARLTLSWDPATERARVHQLSEGDVAQQRARTTKLLGYMHRTRRRQLPKLHAFAKYEELGAGSRVWLGAAEVAVTQ